MAVFDIGDQSARDIYQAETIHVHAPAAEPDHAAQGMRAFHAGNYQIACAELSAAVRRRPADPQLNYYLGLCLLRGRRPHMHRAADVAEIRAHLDIAVSALPEAAALSMLVAEDYRTAWRNNVGMPRQVVELVRAVSAERAREIVERIVAPESQIWKLLALRAEGKLT